MTAEELIKGLRERDYFIIRMREPATVLLPRVEENDTLLPWLRDQLHCVMVRYQPEPVGNPGHYAYEVRLSTAAIVVDETDLRPAEPGYSERLAMRRARAVWDAAGEARRDEAEDLVLEHGR